jgi:hypothetical protein
VDFGTSMILKTTSPNKTHANQDECNTHITILFNFKKQIIVSCTKFLVKKINVRKLLKL